MTLSLNQQQASRVSNVAAACLAYEKSVDYPLGVAIVEYHFGSGSADAVIEALAPFQNEDGGFGKGLEVDIAAPVSNPFAARLAMQVLLSLRARPDHALVDRLANWLNETQHEDGDWHFSDEVKAGALAPWFANWTFPSLIPSCSIVGLGSRLGLLTEPTIERTATLFDAMATPELARNADFYGLLPYSEYVPALRHPQRDAFIDAIAANIDATEYDDASHYLDHALSGGPDLASRLDQSRLSRMIDQLLDEPQADGGWPNPYSDAWRPFASAAAIMTLAKLRSGI